MSPTTDGSSSSPSHLLGRPSSGGGTRPSTAGSDRAHDSNVNVWGSNSRPSSASGVLASNHASAASSRPRSADNRPGSSHLSRFAEPAPEGSGVWGATGAAERMVCLFNKLPYMNCFYEKRMHKSDSCGVFQHSYVNSKS